MSITLKVADGDWVLAPTGRVEVVQGIEKCGQDIAETLMMDYSPEFENGNEIFGMNVPVVASRVAMPQLISFKLAEAIDRLMALQDKTPYTTLDEAIDKLEDLQVYLGTQLDAVVYLAFVTKSSMPVEKVYDVSLKHQVNYEVMRAAAASVSTKLVGE